MEVVKRAIKDWQEYEAIPNPSFKQSGLLKVYRAVQTSSNFGPYNELTINVVAVVQEEKRSIGLGWLCNQIQKE